MSSPCLILALLLLVPGLLAGEARFERWRWSNPLPHGNNVMDMVLGDTVSVQVGDGGTVYVMGQDDRWAPAVTGVTNYLRSVALFGTRIIAVGEEGCILWSDDGLHFDKSQLSHQTKNWFEGVAASGQRAVAVGDEGMIYTSTNGIYWTTNANSRTSEWLRSVAFGNNVFVAVGETGTILRSSSNPANVWTNIISGTIANLNRVRYLNSDEGSAFITVGMGGVALSSATGTAPWSSLSSGTTNTLFDVASNPGGRLLVGDQEIRYKPTSGSWTNQITGLQTNAAAAWTYYSAWGSSNHWTVAGRTGALVEGTRTNASDFYSWSDSYISPRAWLWDMTVQKGICVAVGDLATIQTSLDGLLWAREAVPGSYTNVVLLGVGGSTNLLISVGNSGTILYSAAGLTNLTVTNYSGTNIIVTNSTFETLGVVWTNGVPFTTNTLQGVAGREGLYVVSGDRGTLFTSADAAAWVARATSTTNFLSGVAVSPQACVAVGARGTLLRASSDASGWSTVATGTTNWLYRVRYVGGVFVAVGQNGVILTSSDATSWATRTSGSKAWLNDVTWLDGKWWVAGSQGTLLSSSNLVSWVAVPIPTIKSLYTAANWGGKLMVAGIEGVILRNQVEPLSEPVNFVDYRRTLAMTGTNATSYLAAYELFLFGGVPDQFFEFQSSTSMQTNAWGSYGTFEIFDPSGTIYLIRTRAQTNSPASEFYRTLLVP